MNRSARAPFSNADSSGISHVDSLFRRFAVEVFVVGLRFSAGVVDNIVSMIRRRIERIELQGNHYREAGADRRPNAIENRFTGPFLHAKELVEVVDPVLAVIPRFEKFQR